jgi:hypothetical protein
LFHHKNIILISILRRYAYIILVWGDLKGCCMEDEERDCKDEIKTVIVVRKGVGGLFNSKTRTLPI